MVVIGLRFSEEARYVCVVLAVSCYAVTVVLFIQCRCPRCACERMILLAYYNLGQHGNSHHQYQNTSKYIF